MREDEQNKLNLPVHTHMPACLNISREYALFIPRLGAIPFSRN